MKLFIRSLSIMILITSAYLFLMDSQAHTASETFVRDLQIESQPGDLKDVFISKDIEIKVNPEKVYLEKIEDYVGWVSIDNTKIDYPIVRGRDNEFYLDHNYMKEPYIGGAIFMDRRNLGAGLDNHTIVYGHYMKNGTMFTALNKYLKKDFYETNKIIEIRDLYKTRKYKVIAAYYVSADDFTLPYKIDQEVYRTLMEKAINGGETPYSEDMKFLTLSTCNYIMTNGRMIVHAVEVK